MDSEHYGTGNIALGSGLHSRVNIVSGIVRAQQTRHLIFHLIDNIRSERSGRCYSSGEGVVLDICNLHSRNLGNSIGYRGLKRSTSDLGKNVYNGRRGSRTTLKRSSCVDGRGRGSVGAEAGVLGCAGFGTGDSISRKTATVDYTVLGLARGARSSGVSGAAGCAFSGASSNLTVSGRSSARCASVLILKLSTSTSSDKSGRSRTTGALSTTTITIDVKACITCRTF